MCVPVDGSVRRKYSDDGVLLPLVLFYGLLFGASCSADDDDDNDGDIAVTVADANAHTKRVRIDDELIMSLI